MNIEARDNPLSFFTYNNCRSTDFSIIISKSNIYNSAAPKNDEITIPGRNGALLINEGEFEMVDVIYNCWTYPHYPLIKAAKRIKAFLLSNIGYSKLSDTYDTDYYRMAYYNSAIDIEEQVRNVGVFNVSFRCKPFKQSYLGDKAIEFAKDGILRNPESFVSLPDIRLYGNGTVSLTVNDSTYIVDNVNGSVTINSEVMETYSDGYSYNGYKRGAAGYPILNPGNNEISFEADKIEIVPRWRTI